MHAHVREPVRALARGGGFVFQQVQNILAFVPPENVVAMLDSVNPAGGASGGGKLPAAPSSSSWPPGVPRAVRAMLMRMLKSAFLAGTGRALARRPVLSWIVLSLSLASQVAGGVAWHVSSLAAELSLGAGASTPVALAVSAGLSVAVFLSSNKHAFRLLIALRALTLLMVVPSSRAFPGMDLALTLPVLMEAAIYEPFFVNLLIGTGVVALVLASRLAESTPLPSGPLGWTRLFLDHGGYAVYSLLFASVACLVVHFREQVLQMREQVARLDQAVGQLSSANLGYQQYANTVEQASMMEERKRITREIHDTIGYTLTSNIMMMEAAIDMVRRDPEEVKTLMETARANARVGLEQIRNALHILRAQEEPRVPLANLIEGLAQVFRQATEVDVVVNYGNLPDSLLPAAEAALHHFVQECLTNSFRHGQATRVEITLWVNDGGHLLAYVSDNGKGADKVEEGIGLAGMRERLAALRGTLEVLSRVGGFTVMADIPLACESRGAAAGTP